MRVAALYDVHGNLPALEAVLADPRCAAAEAIVSGGDLVAGPMPRECLERLLSLGERVVFLRGNGDREVAERDDGPSAWCRERLGPELTERLRSWPLVVEREVPGLGAVTFCHATPRSDEEILTRVTPEADVAEAVAGASRLVVVGHTHVQFDRRVGARRVVNAGSVGWPYEGRHGAYWALLGPPRGSEPQAGRVELVATGYPAAAAAEAIRATGYPLAEDLAANLLSPYTADEATEELEARRRGA